MTTIFNSRGRYAHREPAYCVVMERVARRRLGTGVPPGLQNRCAVETRWVGSIPIRLRYYNLLPGHRVAERAEIEPNERSCLARVWRPSGFLLTDC